MGHTRHNSRPTIGFLIGQMQERYQSLVWPGAAEAAREHDANLICIAGRALGSPSAWDAPRNVIYDLAGPDNVDGLVILSGTLGQYVGADRFRRFCRRYHPLPVVSISLALEGIPSILVDNVQGIRDIMAHLIEEHAARRIAFIRGPDGHQEADQRYDTYVQTLVEHSIDPDLDLVAPGDFAIEDGAEAIRLLLDERSADFDAVLGANDNMAIGALRALEARGIRVPQDKLVAGFDDIEMGRHIAPPLTTVRQPLHAQGKRAAETLLALLAGEEVPPRTTLPTELVVRRSCGCFSQTVKRAAARGGPSAPTPLIEQREAVLAELAQVAGLRPEWSACLFDAFSEALETGSPESMLLPFDSILDQAVEAGYPVIRWQDALSALRRLTRPALTASTSLPLAENLWQQARVMISETVYRMQENNWLQAVEQTLVSNEVSEALMTTFDVEGLTDAVYEQLPRMGIARCYLALYDGNKSPADWSWLVLAYDENGPIEIPPGHHRFRSRQLVPMGILPEDERFSLVLEPLHFRDEQQLGFALFGIPDQNRTNHELVGRQISTALKGALLLHERQQAQRAMQAYSEQLEYLVWARTRELEQAQEELVRKEKLALLGQLAGGVAHELRNPLGLIKGSAYFLDMVLTQQDEEMEKSLQILKTGVEKCESIISTLLGFARSEAAFWKQVDVNQAIGDALSSVGEIDRIEVVSHLDPALPRLLADPNQLGIVFDNIILNACQAMPNGGTLTITSSISDQDSIEIHFADTGCGIKKENLPNLFEPLFTTKAKGIGLGLALVKTLVERHGGSIRVESEVGRGTTFHLTFPVTETLESEA